MTSTEIETELDRKTPSVLEVQNLSKTYAEGTKALESITFTIPLGKVFGLLGPNGSGKSTFFNILANVLSPTEGKILYGDLEITNNKNWAKNNIRLCPQKDVVYEYLTVQENLELFAELYDLPKDSYKPYIEELLKTLQMEEKRATRASSLSGGQLKRLGLMLALLTRPQIILLDEPMAGLDIASRQALHQYIREIRDQKTLTIILSTHNFADARAMCENIALLNRGQISMVGTTEEIFQSKTLDEIFQVDII
jgi:ABC-2 type transport system ATP-binding protein